MGPRARKSPRKQQHARLRSTASRALIAQAPAVPPAELTVPTRWVKALVGVCLIPLCWVTAAAFFSLLAHSAPRGAFWLSEPFWFFSLGAVVWAIAFVGLPRPVMLYVLGHEITHALWACAMGGRILHLQANRRGGRVVTDRANFLVALAPYFFPIYSMMVLVPLGLVSPGDEAVLARRALLFLLGLTWSFHATFSLWMIGRRQSDILAHGTLFSLAFIALANVVVLSLFLILASPTVTFADFGREWVFQTVAW